MNKTTLRQYYKREKSSGGTLAARSLQLRGALACGEYIDFPIHYRYTKLGTLRCAKDKEPAKFFNVAERSL